MNNSVEIQTVIRRLRLELTLEELSEKLDVAVKTISRWESGKNEPGFTSVKKIILLCSKRGIKWDDLFYFWTFMSCYFVLLYTRIISKGVI